MVERIIKMVLLFTLGVISIYDCKTRNVSIPVLVIGSGILLLLFPFNENVNLITALGGVFLGIVMLVVSLVSKGRIGFGDGLVFCMTGVCLGFWDNLSLISLSFLLAGVFGLAGLGMKKLTIKQRIPFVPFVTLSYLGMICL